MSLSRMTAADFGWQNFGGADLGDERLNKRLVNVGTQMAKHPGGTLPAKMKDPAPLKGLYRLVDHKKVTHTQVLQPHKERTHRQMRACKGAVLVLHDTTELDYSGLKSVHKDLGQIGNGGGRGYKCHNTLAVAADTREVLGLANQILFCRADVSKGETKEARRKRSTRESLLWLHGSQAVPAAPEGHLWVDVADRGADTNEFLDYEDFQGKKYLVRSQHNRWVQPGHEGDVNAGDERVKLHDWLREFPDKGRRTVKVPARAGQPARTATVGVTWARIRVLRSRQPRGNGRGVSLPVWAVRVWELVPPKHVKEPLEWILLTNVAVSRFEDAGDRIDWYTFRWIIEEYHKAMKTGCNIEQMEFTKVDRLQPAIALVSVVAILLLTLRDSSRRPDRNRQRARDVIPSEYVAVLAAWRYRDPDRDLTVHEFYYALARLGGHQNRRSDHPPGWLVLWRGWTELHIMVEGAAAMGVLRCG